MEGAQPVTQQKTAWSPAQGVQRAGLRLMSMGLGTALCTVLAGAHQLGRAKEENDLSL